MTKFISTADAAKRLGVTQRRIQAMILAGQLPAELVGSRYIIAEKNLEKVANRKPGRPKKT